MTASPLSAGIDYETLANRCRPLFREIAAGNVEREHARELPDCLRLNAAIGATLDLRRVPGVQPREFIELSEGHSRSGAGFSQTVGE